MALSKDLKNLIASAEAGETNNAKHGSALFHEAFAALLMWAESFATQIQWVIAGVPHDSTAAAVDLADNTKLSYTLGLQLGTAADVLVPFTQAQSVVITLTGTATGKKVNGVAGPLTVDLVDGAASVTLSRDAGSADETIIATLSAPTTGSANGAFTLTF